MTDSNVLTPVTEGKLEDVEAELADRPMFERDKRVLINELREIRRQLGRYDGSNALESFLVEFMQTAELGKVPDYNHDDGELRPEMERALEVDTLCTCGHVTCPVNNGRLPGQLHHHGSGRYRRAKDVETELADYLREHPEALILREAKAVWDEWKGDILARVSMLKAATDRAVDRHKDDNTESEPLRVGLQA